MLYYDAPFSLRVQVMAFVVVTHVELTLCQTILYFCRTYYCTDMYTIVSELWAVSNILLYRYTVISELWALFIILLYWYTIISELWALSTTLLYWYTVLLFQSSELCRKPPYSCLTVTQNTLLLMHSKNKRKCFLGRNCSIPMQEHDCICLCTHYGVKQ